MDDARTRHRSTSSDGGFTLVEVIVSMVLLGLASLLVLPVVVTGMKAGVANRDIATAAQLADAELDRARSAAATLSGCPAVVAAHSGSMVANPVGYTVRDAVTGTCTTGGLLTVRVTVTSSADPSRSATAVTQVVVGP